MHWQSEAEFVEAFVSSAHQKTSRRSIKVWRELRTGYGRPDIAIVEYDPKVLTHRLQKERTSHVDSLWSKSAYAIAFLSTRRWVSIEYFGKSLNYQGSLLRNVLDDLMNRGLIMKKDHLIKALPRDEILAIRKISVFEAKLSQWKEAIDQAERHLWFTNNSYVLMPMKSEEMLSSISKECQRRGVGMSVYEPELGVKNVQPVMKSTLINSPLLWSFNEKVLEEEYESRAIHSGIPCAAGSFSNANN